MLPHCPVVRTHVRSHIRNRVLSFKTLTDEEQKEFWRLSRFYWKEALRCEEVKAHLAGAVMLGSALEALLTLMVDCHSEEAELTGEIPTKKGKAKPLLDWQLSELLKVAKAANWLPVGPGANGDWNHKAAKIGDYAELVRRLRNLLHPARYTKDHSGKRVTRKYLQTQFEVALLCRDWLVSHNNKRLLEDLAKEDCQGNSGH
jgi:hypothetical protein